MAAARHSGSVACPVPWPSEDAHSAAIHGAAARRLSADTEPIPRRSQPSYAVAAGYGLEGALGGTGALPMTFVV